MTQGLLDPPPAPAMVTAPAAETTARRAVSFRSVTAGLAGVVVCCALTPYNDLILRNGSFTGYSMPVVAVCVALLYAVTVNGPLSRRRSRWAMGTGELAVFFSMMLVGCSLPASGLMRYFVPTLVSPFWYAGAHDGAMTLLESMDLPAWLFPTMTGDTPRQWAQDPHVSGYIGRWTEAGTPYAAWITPAATWGFFLLMLTLAVGCLLSILHRQWFVNERLAFPLAEVQLALIEAPSPGRWFNQTLASRSFRAAFVLVILLHGWNTLAEYQPRHFPTIPLGFDLSAVLADAPWSFASKRLKANSIVFVVVGATYFTPLPVSFSLWFFFLFDQALSMGRGVATGDGVIPGRNDIHIGAVLGYLGVAVWAGRAHWRLVAAQAIRGVRGGEARGTYLSHPVAAWGFVLCFGGCVAWLVAAGMTLLAAGVTMTLLLALFAAVTRIVAETGLVYGQLKFGLTRPWEILAGAGVAHPVPVQSFYLASMLNATHYDLREPTMLYGAHAMKLRDLGDESAGGRGAGGAAFLGALLLAMVVAYPVSFASTLWCEYGWASSIDDAPETPLNNWAVTDNVTGKILDPASAYQRNKPAQPGDPGLSLGIGATATWLLGVLRLRFASWPLHPVGFVMASTSPAGRLWFSILIGWLTKVLLLRLGGAGLYRRGKSFFIGLMFGEAAFIGLCFLWAVLAHVLGWEAKSISFMP